MSPTLARHQHKHTTHTSSPPTQAHHLRNPRYHKQHAISQTPGYPIKVLKLYALIFREEIQQFLLLVFIFTGFTFQAFLSNFINVSKTAMQKLNRELSSLTFLLIQKTTIFSKINAQFFIIKSITRTLITIYLSARSSGHHQSV